jgi:hypothetical protein
MREKNEACHEDRRSAAKKNTKVVIVPTANNRQNTLRPSKPGLGQRHIFLRLKKTRHVGQKHALRRVF